MSIAYAVGNQFCVLSIPKRKAEQCGINDPNEVEIQATSKGILIKRKDAASQGTSSSGIGLAEIKTPREGDDF